MTFNSKINQNGIAIIWIVVIMVVVSVLGVAMLRLYSMSTAGWVDANASNESKMMADSGLRFFSSEYQSQSNDKKKNELIDELNDKTFKLSTTSEGQFKLDISSYFYRVVSVGPLKLKFVGAPGFNVPTPGSLKIDGDDTVYGYNGYNDLGNGVYEFSSISGGAAAEYTTVRPVVQTSINAVSEGGPLTLGSVGNNLATIFPDENGMFMIEKKQIKANLPVKTTVPYRYEYRNDDQLINVQKGPNQSTFTNIDASGSANVEVAKLITVESTGSFSDIASKKNTYQLSLDHGRFTPGLKSYWSFDDPGTPGRDSYGTSEGTLSGVTPPAYIASGKVGGALQFTGAGYVTTTFKPSLAIGSGQPFTIVFWAKPDTVAVDDTARVVIGASDSSSIPIKQFGIWTYNGKWVWGLGSKDGTMYEGTNPDSLPVASTDWQHVAYVYNGNDIFLYFNGIKKYEYLGFGTSAQLPDLGVGIGAAITSGGPSSYFTGLIDEVAIFDTALAFCEINTIFHVPAVVPCNIGCYLDPVAYYPFNGNSKDQSGADWDGNPAVYNATATGASPTQDQCGNTNKAYSFDGNDYMNTSINPNTVIVDSRPFTVAFWAKPNQSNVFQTVVGAFDVDNSQRFYIAVYYGGWLWGYGNANNETDTSKLPVAAGEWVHVGFVYDDGVASGTGIKKVNIYVNGTEKSYTYSGDGNLPNLSTYIGARREYYTSTSCFGCPNTYFTGIIDEVLIWKRALSSTEMSNLYRGTKP